jgi:hypothetical protein
VTLASLVAELKLAGVLKFGNLNKFTHRAPFFGAGM